MSRFRLPAFLAALVALLAVAAVAAGHPLDVTDSDHDKFKNFADNCPNNYNPKQTDTDGDTPEPIFIHEGNPTTGPIQVYPFTDGQGLPTDRAPDVGGDACDNDDDGDGITDNPKRDNCKLDPNPGQEDNDSDGIGDVCDEDDDNDETFDAVDNCPTTSNSNQVDFDKDGKGDACDPDGPKAKGSGLKGGDPNDKAAPKVSLRLARRYRFQELGAGLAVGARCSEGCVLEAELRHARKLIGRGAAQVEERGFTFAFVKFSGKSMRRLKRAGFAMTTLTVKATDANGNTARVRRKLRLTH